VTVKYYCYGLLHKVYLMLCMMCKYFEKLTPVTVQNNHIKVDDFLEILSFASEICFSYDKIPKMKLFQKAGVWTLT